MIYLAESLNLLMSLVGLAWAAGSDPKRRDTTAHRGWVLFWVGTAAYYAADLARQHLQGGPPFPCVAPRWWVPHIGLYFATAALLTTYALTERYADRWSCVGIVCSAVGLVAAAAVADIQTTVCDHPARWHQALACIAILLWAFRLRHREPSRSVVMAVYGLLQFPLLQMFPRATATGYDWLSFIQHNYFALAACKVPLIPAVYFAIERPPWALLERYAPRGDSSVSPRNETWDVFISYAFEDVADARTVRDALAALGVRAFVASDDLNARAGAKQWSEEIDDLLDRTPALAVLATPNSNKSRWVRYEWRSYHEDIQGGRNATLVAIRLDGVQPEDLPRALRHYTSIELSDDAGRAIAATVAPMRPEPPTDSEPGED